MTLVRSIFLALVFTFAAGTIAHAADEAPAAEAPKKEKKAKKAKKAEGGEEKKAEEKK
ncbi:MAG TPA: hypothetical protein VHJ20_06100 [Polyangia bacterium]|nr:hypothetical protein [Polyangia bacterium]